GAVLAGPAGGGGERRFLVGGYRFVGEPVFELGGERRRRRVTVLRTQRHRLQADGLQRLGDAWQPLSWFRIIPFLDPAEDRSDVVLVEGGHAGQHVVQRRTQAVYVAGRAELVQAASRLLGAHVLRRADRHAGQRFARSAAGRFYERFGAGGALFLLTERLGQPPVHDQRLAVFSEHDVAGLQIAVQHAPAV